ncbi:hypothetical protein SDC9_200352 [bioreactor metagenome]|uniref:Uncharacterized protein n=1 Tax=bioreactor metagenome TaxID=1076179 RepID=A0A645INL0_9ZZZZ
MSFNENNSSLSVVIKLFFGAATIVFAEIYSEYLGGMIKKSCLLKRREKINMTKEAFWIFIVSVVPIFLFIISHFGLINIHIAFLVSHILGLVGLLVFGFIASNSVYCHFSKNFRAALFTGIIGLILIFAKSLIH